MSDIEKCNLYTFNSTDPFHIGNTYGGLPTNLVTNLIGWTFLMLLFVMVRKSAYKYIKLKRLERMSSELNFMNKIAQLFHSGNTNAELVDNKEVQPEMNSSVTESGEPPDNVNHVPDDIDVPDIVQHLDPNEDSRNLTDDRISRSFSLEEEDGFWSWFVKIFTMSDRKLESLVGDDAVQYLRFQRYIIGYMFITTTLSVCVILPLNFQGDLQGNTTDFGHTTLSNLDPASPFLWVHITIAFLLFPIAIFTMRKFSTGLKFRDPGLEITPTICIENIPLNMCTEELIRRHMKEAYPRIELYDVKIVYDVTKLTKAHNELLDALSCYEYGVKYKDKHDRGLSMYPHCCSRLCCCFCSPCSTAVDVVEFYGDQITELQSNVIKLKEMSLHSPLGMAFVTFNSVNGAKYVYEDHEPSILSRYNKKSAISSLSSSIKSNDWKVWFAPPPRDIYWEHLSDKRQWLLLKWLLSNIILFCVTFFLTTPEYAVSQFDTILIALFGPTMDFQGSTGGSWIKDFIPTVMLWSFTALLPLLVSYSDRWLGRWTRSEENHSVMRKTFWYLLFMVIILPTFGFTTGKAYFNFLFQNNTDTYKWECIFLPDSGAFFVNYVITAALIGSALELIRFPEMFWYMVQLCFSRSKAETPAIQRAVTYEFRFGEQYARMLLIFAMVMMYSLSCPLITPFGCLYFLLKHFADRHNLAFVYAPSKINKKVHASAINFVIMSVGLLQFFMVIFSILRSGDFSNITPRTKYALVLFVITINIFTAQIWSNFCRKLSPIK
ncbi:CSC1-like protein 2 [Eurytemora carolleeae]|uniref:CSC1-like protein 2 n=1 Tax=Eurytemora carolleeae TaxID=1294199 RepID=UPI000C76F125|nr:CSC1-like protein 2 [Eurytemora carolleeae]|eukprot:XP_023342328.1 CSC1-like protein 2 [Eurytemora affinis]